MHTYVTQQRRPDPRPNPNRARPLPLCCVSVMPAPQIVYYQLGAIKVSWPYCASFIFGHRVTFFYCPPRRCSCLLCAQRFPSSTACQHKMDMYQLIFTARAGETALVNSGSQQLLCALYSSFLCLSLSISISKFNVLATAHASRGNLFDGAACAVAPPPPRLSTGTCSHCAMTAIKGHEHKLPHKSVERGADSIPNATSATKIIAQVKGR